MAEQIRHRLRINLSQGELEIEGSEAFVERYAEQVDRLLAHLHNGEAPEPVPAPSPAPNGNGRHAPLANEPPASFGDMLQHLSRSVTDVDRILVAGHFTQLHSADRSFATGEANALLLEQGIKLGNPSQCVKQNLIAKRVFRHQRRYRITQTGMDHLRQLLGAAFLG